MEEYDDLSSGPSDGRFNLSYNNWTEIPPELYEKYRSLLLSLSLSHNKLTHISSSTKDNHVYNNLSLTLLQDLDLSHNQIEVIESGSIGKLIRLRKLNVCHNLLECLPDDLNNCLMMDTLIVNDNKLTHLPELHMMPGLETIDLRNNELKSIPGQICSIECLKNVPCDGNKDLATVPPDMQTDSELVLWTLRLHQANDETVKRKMNEYKKVELIAQQTELEKINDLTIDLELLEREVQLLRLDRPIEYMKFKDRVCYVLDVVQRKMVQCRDAVSSKVSGLRKRQVKVAVVGVDEGGGVGDEMEF